MSAERSVTAVLGPTNTGKTHLAIERLVGHETGMIGLPLRLLAREVYNRVVEKVGADKVALVTGEEKITPSEARYWVCTVEAMPEDVDVDFLAVDEVQLAGDLDRGHVFTNRILNRRGNNETLLLGAQTIKPLIEALLPQANIVTRPRMSILSYAGEKKITRLPRRSAVVAFSASEVYAIAELIRRQRGGAAVVLGALSPRTRNAQVAIYQEGDVDFLVATDAIGMGLNLDVDHVAFANDRKFDGFQHRRLTPAEFSQIAGRAGRFTRDGTFGVTGQAAPLEAELVERLESHTFDAMQVLQWRNADLDFSSAATLKASLDGTPTQKGLTRAPMSEDRQALEYALNDKEIAALAKCPKTVELLWSACALPDYRNIAPTNHAELITTIYRHIHNGGVIPENWFAQQVGFADRNDGDIDTLSNRIAHVRTWTFVANRADWLKEPEYWRGVTREVEDRLSDALHERLTQRFIDRRTSVLMKRLQADEQLEAHIEPDGAIHVENHFLGRIEGLTFHPDKTSEASHDKAIRSAAQRVLAEEMRNRADLLSTARDGAISLARDGRILWQGAPVARLSKSDDLLKPRIELKADDALTGASRERAEARLQAWLAGETEARIKPLIDLRAADGLEGIARGVAFRIVEGLGVLPRAEAADEIQQIDQETRAKLRALGVRFGAYHVFVPALLKPGPRTLLAQLFALSSEASQDGLNRILALSASGRTSVPVEADLAPELYGAVGYRVCGQMAVRIDILERLADLIRPLIAWRGGHENSETRRPEGAEPGNAFRRTVAMTSLVGCAGDEFASILTSLGYRRETRQEPAPPPTAARKADVVPDTSAASQVEQRAAETEPKPAQAASGVDRPEETAKPEPNIETKPQEPRETAQLEATDGETASDATGEPEMVTVEIWRLRPPRRQRGPRQQGERARQRSGTGEKPGDGNTEDQQTSESEGNRRKQPQKHTDSKKQRGKRRPAEAQASGRRNQGNQKRNEQQRRSAPDPDSPFAALAALKEQMEKEKR